MWKAVAYITTLSIIAFALWLITNLPIPNEINRPFPLHLLADEVYERLYNWRGVVALTLFLVHGFAWGGAYYPYRRRERRYYGRLLRHVIESEFKGSPAQIRGTIFIIRSGFYTFFWFWFFCILWNYRTLRRKHSLRYYLDRRPNLFRQYLLVFSRSGSPFEKGSLSFFLVPQERAEVESFAAHTLLEESACNISLPDVRGIDFSKVISSNELPDDIAAKVLEYGEKGFMTYEAMRALNRLSTDLWATPLHDKNENQWGVLIFDLEPNTMQINSQLNNRLVNFSHRLSTHIRLYL